MNAIVFNSQQFNEFVAFAKTFGRSQQAVLHVENGMLVCRASKGNSSLIEFRIELYNEDECELHDEINISIDDFLALTQGAYGLDKYTIRKEFGQYEFNITGYGWLQFRTYEQERPLLNIDSGALELLGTYNSSAIRRALYPCIGYTQNYTRPYEMYLQFANNKLFVTSRLSCVQTDVEFANIVLHRDDASNLLNLLNGNFEFNVFKSVTDAERLVFESSKFRYIITASELENVAIPSPPELSGYISVNRSDLFQLINLSMKYSLSKKSVGLSINNGAFYVSIKNVLSQKHRSMIRANVTGDLYNFEEREFSSTELMKILKLFQDRRVETVNISFANNMLVIYDGEGSVALIYT